MQNLELLERLVHGVATQFNSSCKVVIHDLTRNDSDNSIIYTESGHVGNRQLKDGPSEIVLETLNSSLEWFQDKLSYPTRTDDERILKSNTMYIRGDDARVNYIFSLNYDITGLITVDRALRDLIPTNSEPNKQPRKITHNVNDPLDTLIEQSTVLVGKSVALMTRDDKMTTIQFLNDSSAFLTTESGDKISSYFGISKFMLYSYMDSSRESRDAKDNE